MPPLKHYRICNMFSVKDPVPSELHSLVVYKFSLQAVVLVTLVKLEDTSRYALASI